MHEFLAQFAIVVIAHLLAVISPGPDLIVVSKNTISYSRQIGIYTALGVALGIGVHVGYSLLGVGFIISKSIIIFNLIKTLGAFYLVYLGYKMLKSKPNTSESSENIFETKNDSLMPPFSAIKNGFLVNVLNPKATLFFLALFTQVIGQSTPSFVKLVYGIEMMLMTFVWFTLVALLLSHNTLKHRINKVQTVIDKITGVVLIAIGLKVFISNK